MVVQDVQLEFSSLLFRSGCRGVFIFYLPRYFESMRWTSDVYVYTCLKMCFTSRKIHAADYEVKMLRLTMGHFKGVIEESQIYIRATFELNTLLKKHEVT